MQNSRILVAGGAGFIGSHLCRRLLADGQTVICVDNFLTGSRDNIAPLMDHANFSLVEQSVEYPIYMDVDQIYNMACPASPVHYQKDPILTFKTSVLGALQMLGLAKHNKAKILQASTSEIYGDPLCHPQQEAYWGNVNPIGIRSCYDEGKRAAETLCMDYHRQHGVCVKIIRIFNTYGPNMQPDDGRVISNFIVQALKGRDLTIYGDGAQSRSFQYVDNLIDGMIKIMNDTPDDFPGPVNLGNPYEYTVEQLARRVIEMTGSDVGITYRPLPEDDPRQRRPDITLAKELIDYNPTIELDAGLRLTIDYFKGLMNQGKI